MTKRREVFEASYLETSLTYARSVGKSRGLAGLGTFHLDCFDLFGEERFLRSASQLANGIMLQKMSQPEGIAFPGRQQSHISCDYSQGMAGTVSFLNRLEHDTGEILPLTPATLRKRRA